MGLPKKTSLTKKVDLANELTTFLSNYKEAPLEPPNEKSELSNQIDTFISNFKIDDKSLRESLEKFCKTLCGHEVFFSERRKGNRTEKDTWIQNFTVFTKNLPKDFRVNDSFEYLQILTSTLDLETIKKRFLFWQKIAPYLSEKTDQLSLFHNYISEMKKYENSIVKDGGILSFRQNEWNLMTSIYPHIEPEKLVRKDGMGDNNQYLAPINHDNTHIEATTDIAQKDRLVIDDISLKKLEAIRPKLFDANILACGAIVTLLQSGDVDKFTSKIEEIISEKLMADDVDFLLLLDGSIASIVTKSTQELYRNVRNGSLTNLFNILGRFEKEEKVGTFREVSNFISGLKLNINPINALTLTLYVDESSFDKSYDLFNSKIKDEKEFWTEYERRMNTFIQTGLNEEITITKKVKRKIKSNYTVALKEFADYLNMELTVKQNPLINSYLSPVSNSQESPAENVFTKSGEMWTITFNKKTIHLPDSKGLQYISHLLKNQDRKIDCLDLSAIINESYKNEAGKGTLDYERKDEIEDSGMVGKRLSSQDKLLDDKGRQVLRDRLEELREKLTTSSYSSQYEHEEIEDEIEKIQKLLKQVTTPTGKIKNFEGDKDKARKAVSNAIKATMEKLKSSHEDLWKHFYSCLKTGQSCSYIPHPKVTWNL